MENLNEPRTSPTRIQMLFPLGLQEDFESPVNNSPYVVGVNKYYPAQLRKMISASVIAYSLQYKSIDNVLKTHLKDVVYDEDPRGGIRLDRQIRYSCTSSLSTCYDLIVSYPSLLKREARIGEWVSDFTLSRLGYSVGRAFGEADRGALYEAVCICRMALEQLAWCFAIRDSDESNFIHSKKAPASVSELSRFLDGVGNFYGWMSAHAHWNSKAHYKAIAKSSDGRFGAWHCNSDFKFQAYMCLICLFLISVRLYLHFLKEYEGLMAVPAFSDLVGDLDLPRMIEALEKDADVDQSEVTELFGIMRRIYDNGRTHAS